MQQRVQTVCLVILTTIAAGAALAWLRPVMIPFVLAVFIAVSLRPLIDLQVLRLRLPRPLALLTTLVMSLVLLTTLGSLVSASVGQLSANAGLYSQQLGKLTEQVVASLPDDLGRLAGEADLRQLLESPVQSVGRVLMGTTNAILDLLSKSLMVFLFVTFLLIGSATAEAPAVWRDVRSNIERYLIAKAVISAATGLLVGAILSLLGVDLALVFGLLAFLLNFIPSLGSIIATLLPLPVVIVSPQISTGAAVAAIAIPGAIQLVIGNFLEPRIMGHRLDLHPVTVLLGLMVWGMLWGIVGMLLATPIIAVIRMLLARFEGSRPLADLMAGRLRPHEPVSAS